LLVSTVVKDGQYRLKQHTVMRISCWMNKMQQKVINWIFGELRIALACSTSCKQVRHCKLLWGVSLWPYQWRIRDKITLTTG
jgi:hypothetical protein